MSDPLSTTGQESTSTPTTDDQKPDVTLESLSLTMVGVLKERRRKELADKEREEREERLLQEAMRQRAISDSVMSYLDEVGAGALVSFVANGPYPVTRCSSINREMVNVPIVVPGHRTIQLRLLKCHANGCEHVVVWAPVSCATADEWPDWTVLMPVDHPSQDYREEPFGNIADALIAAEIPVAPDDPPAPF